MSLASLLRWLPTPGYGKCGGAWKDCSTRPPVSRMDVLFQEHDQNLWQAEQLPEPERTLAIIESDNELYKGLKNIDPKELPLYDRIYRWFALKVFN